MMDDHTADETFRGDANKDKCIKFFHGVKSVAGGPGGEKKMTQRNSPSFRSQRGINDVIGKWKAVLLFVCDWMKANTPRPRRTSRVLPTLGRDTNAQPLRQMSPRHRSLASNPGLDPGPGPGPAPPPAKKKTLASPSVGSVNHEDASIPDPGGVFQFSILFLQSIVKSWSLGIPEWRLHSLILGLHDRWRY